MKTCSVCQTAKSPDAFYPGYTKCRLCCAAEYAASPRGIACAARRAARAATKIAMALRNGRICNACNTEKPISEFQIVKGIPYTQCKPCKRAKTAVARLAPGFQAKATVTHRKWLNKKLTTEPDYLRGKHMKTAYGITLKQFNALLTEQGGKCAICDGTEGLGRRNRRKGMDSLHVDHDHVTGKVRGILCANCNKALGCMKDSATLLMRAAEYLRCPPTGYMRPQFNAVQAQA